MGRMGKNTQRAVVGAFCIATSACAQPESVRDDEITVRSGRLVFANVQAFSKMVEDLNTLPAGVLPAEHTEANFAGFRPFGRDGGDAAMPRVLQGILNQDKLFQIEEEIHLLGDGIEFVVPEANAWIVTELMRGSPWEDYVSSGSIRVYGRAREAALEPSQIRGDQTRSLLNAKYQKIFPFEGHTYKLIDEAYIDTFSTFTNVCVRAKMEYLKGSSWKAAGQQVLKRISDGVATATATISVTQRVEEQPLAGERSDSANLVDCAVFSPAPGECFNKFKIRAHFFSQAPTLGPTSYDVQATWDREFELLFQCN